MEKIIGVDYADFVIRDFHKPSRVNVFYLVQHKVLINSDKIAYGVLYRRHGIIQVAHASKEVIVCAGTISSPLLLMRSGIGSKEVLEKAKVIVFHVRSEPC